MTLATELASLAAPAPIKTGPVPKVGGQAPSSDQIGAPGPDGKPTVATFLRHCGCPFAEKPFLSLRTAAQSNPAVRFVAVTHSDQSSTDRWLAAVGGSGPVEIIVDTDRTTYGQWGLGVSSYWHVLSPRTWAGVFSLAWNEKIQNRPTESGTRWQTAGTFAVDGKGVVKYVHVAGYAADMGDVEEAIRALQ